MWSLIFRVLLGWFVLALLFGWFVGSFIKTGRGEDND